MTMLGGMDADTNNDHTALPSESELDALLDVLHRDATCPECVAEPHECCTNAEDDARCAGHSILWNDELLSRWLTMKRTIEHANLEAFRAGLVTWWGERREVVPMAVSLLGAAHAFDLLDGRLDSALRMVTRMSGLA